jgi:5-methylcytosine-specific restriction protein A
MEDKMQDILKRILDEYLIEKTKPLIENELAKFIRRDVVNTIISEASLNTDYYKVTGSAGQGKWAEIPWIAIFDRQITETAQEGYYIIYFFRKDMSGVYLLLDMGWTFFEKEYGVKEGRVKIREVANNFKTIVKSKSVLEFNAAQIDLKSNSKFAVGYELGNICGKFYPKDELPSDETLRHDLLELMRAYSELKGSVGIGDFQDIVKRIENILPYTPDLRNDFDKSNEVSFSEDEEGFPEGKEILREHLVSERNRGVAEIAKNNFKKKHRKLYCEICGFDFSKKYGEVGKNYIECHLTVPVSEMPKDYKTKPEDLVLVCSNCHRMLHRKRPWLGKDELKKLLKT